MASGKEVVHELLVSRDAFVIIADAMLASALVV